VNRKTPIFANFTFKICIYGVKSGLFMPANALVDPCVEAS
jgi:hypothetical protein